MIAVSTLLKSCATPPASWPIACIFWLCAKFSCRVRCSVVSSAKMVALAPSSPRGSAAETKSRAERAAPAPSSDASSGAISPLPWPAASIAARSAARSRSATPVEDRQPCLAGVGLGRRRREAREGGVGAQDRAPRVDRRDRHRGRIEDAGEAHLGGAQVLAFDLAGRAIDHQRAGRARRAVAGEGDPVQDAHRQAAGPGGA